MKKIRILHVSIIFGLLLSLTVSISGITAHASGENNYVYDLAYTENISRETFGDFEIRSSGYLYSLDDNPDYIYVDFKDNGYAIYAKDTMELIEYSPEGNLPYKDDQEKKYYVGPANYYYKDNNDVFVAATSDEELRLKAPAFNKKPILPDAPYPGDEENKINYNYFDTDYPRHGANNHNTCGSVAVQLLLGYNNFYNDRRILSPQYLNGGWHRATNNGNIYDPRNYNAPSQNPNACADPRSLTRQTKGTSDEFYNDVINIVDPGASQCTDTIENGETIHSYKGSDLPDLIRGLNQILGQNLSPSEYTVDSKIILPLGGYNSGIVAEFKAGRPVIIGMSEKLGGVDHWAVGYGCYDYTYPEESAHAGETYSGYFVFTGWPSPHTMWVNTGWCVSYISLKINHTHNMNTDSGNIVNNDKREIRCGICGYREVTDLYQINDSGEILGCNFVLSGEITLPRAINGTTITKIGNNAFANQTAITKMRIPNTVTSMGDNAFSSCTGLKSFIIDRSVNPSLEDVTRIGDYAFSDCVSLYSTSPFHYLTSIGEGAFSNCTELHIFTIPKNTTSIGERAFSGCSNFEIQLDGDNPNFSAYNLEDSEYSTYKNILYNKDKTEIIASGAINSELHIPATVKKISPYAFEGNNNLRILHIEGRTDIGNYAFTECWNLREVNFTERADIGNYAFADCGKLRNVYCYYYYTVSVPGRQAFKNDDFVLHVPNNKLNEYKTAFAQYTTDVAPIYLTVTCVLGGEEFATIEAYYGDTVKYLKTPGKFGYDFSGWYDDPEYDATNPDDPESDGPNYKGTEYKNGMTWKSADKLERIISSNVSALTLYGKLTPRKFSIEFSGEGSENFANKDVTYDSEIGELPTPQKTGHTFLGWKDESGTPYSAGTVWKRASNLTLYSVFEATHYKILYEGNGGTPSIPAQEVIFGCATNELATAEKKGYTFIGWYTREDDTEVDDDTGEPIDAPYTHLIEGDLRLYAKYTPMRYTVTYDVDRSKIPGFPYETTVVYGKTYGFAVPVLDGYTFNGWVDENGRFVTGANGNASLNYWDIEHNTVVTPNFTQNGFTIKVVVKEDNSVVAHWANGGDEEFASPDELNSAYAQSPRDVKEGYIFEYFTSDAENRNRILSWADLDIVTNDDGECIVNIYAKYRKEIFTVIFTNQGNAGSVAGQYAGEFGSNIVYTAAPNIGGKIFVNWVVADIAENNRFAGHYAQGSVFNFKAMPDLTVNSEDDGEVKIYLKPVYETRKCTITLVSERGSFRYKVVMIDYGAIPWLPSNYAEDWDFIGWMMPDGMMVSNDFGWTWGDITVTAVWQPYYRFVELIADNSIYPELNYYDRIYFTKFELPYALQDIEIDGYRFDGWYTGGNNSTRVYQITMDTPGRLYAQFTKIYTVSIYDGDQLIAEIKDTYYSLIQLPTYAKAGYDGCFVSSVMGTYEFGEDLIIRGNERLNLVWTRWT